MIEILVAVTVFSILMLTLFSSFQAFLSSSRALEASAGEDLASGPFLLQIKQDLEAVVVPQPPRFAPPQMMNSTQDPFRFVSIRDMEAGSVFSRLRFTSLNHAAWGPDQAQGAATLVYYVRPDPSGGYDLCRFDRIGERDDETGSCLDPVLVRQVTEFTCKFRDEAGNTYSEWNSDSNTFNYDVPRSVDITLVFDIKEESCRIDTSILLPVKRTVENAEG